MSDSVVHYLLSDEAKARAAVDLMGLSERDEPVAADPFEADTFAAAVERARALSAPVSERQKLDRSSTRPDPGDGAAVAPISPERWDALLAGLSPQERSDLDDALLRDDKRTWDLVTEAYPAAPDAVDDGLDFS